jgi:hypothetical protein
MKKLIILIILLLNFSPNIKAFGNYFLRDCVGYASTAMDIHEQENGCEEDSNVYYIMWTAHYNACMNIQ